jgi:two-component system cell cycle sensor histidine kinase/response regulator CckA
VNLSEFTRDILTLVESSIPRTVELDLQLANELPVIAADIAQLQQLIMNLIINAGEAIGDAPGVVTIRTGVQEFAEGSLRTSLRLRNSAMISGRYVFIEVRDTGCGMDELTKQRIFDPFFTTKFTGRGLGLSAALGIVHGHRGALEVESTPGRGSTFTVLLPETTSHGRVESTPKRADRAGSGIILIVDDEGHKYLPRSRQPDRRRVVGYDHATHEWRGDAETPSRPQARCPDRLVQRLHRDGGSCAIPSQYNRGICPKTVH